jgi:hypothetical protein
MAFSLGICHGTRGNDQRAFVFLEHEERDQVAACIGSSQSSIDIFSGPVARFNKAEMRIIAKDLSDLILLDIVFSLQLVDDLINPDDPADFQTALPLRGILEIFGIDISLMR